MRKVALTTGIAIASMVLAGVAAVAAAEVRVVCANGMRDALRELHGQLEAATGQRVI